MRVLVTGGAGFIGSHVVEQLLHRGDEVVVADDLSRGTSAHVPAPARLHRVDICQADCAELIASYKPEAIIHLAAQMDVSTSAKDPLADANTNILGTLNLLHAAQAVGTQVFVAVSSGGAVYGDATIRPTPEDAPLAPVSPYGASKQCSEVYLDLLDRTSAMRCVSIRPSNVYGPRQSVRGEAGVVAIFAKRMLRGEAPCINGDGTQARDFVFAGDVARALLLCVDNQAARGVYNIGTGIETSLLALVEALSSCTGFSGKPEHKPALAAEVLKSSVCANRAASDLRWTPTTPLHEGLAQTVAFLRESISSAETAATARDDLSRSRQPQNLAPACPAMLPPRPQTRARD